jgi:hypothetical protein
MLFQNLMALIHSEAPASCMKWEKFPAFNGN